MQDAGVDLECSCSLGKVVDLHILLFTSSPSNSCAVDESKLESMLNIFFGQLDFTHHGKLKQQFLCSLS